MRTIGYFILAAMTIGCFAVFWYLLSGSPQSAADEVDDKYAADKQLSRQRKDSNRPSGSPIDRQSALVDRDSKAPVEESVDDSATVATSAGDPTSGPSGAESETSSTESEQLSLAARNRILQHTGWAGDFLASVPAEDLRMLDLLLEEMEASQSDFGRERDRRTIDLLVQGIRTSPEELERQISDLVSEAYLAHASGDRQQVRHLMSRASTLTQVYALPPSRNGGDAALEGAERRLAEFRDSTQR